MITAVEGAATPVAHVAEVVVNDGLRNSRVRYRLLVTYMYVYLGGMYLKVVGHSLCVM